MKLTKSKSKDGRSLYRLETESCIAIPGDIHIPFHDPIALNTFIEHTSGCTLFILGDLFDNYALSTFPKSQDKLAKFTIRKEIEVAAVWLNKLNESYENVIYMPGNHEERWNRLVSKTPALEGMSWWWPLRDIIPASWSLLDVDSRVVLRRGGRSIWFEHGDKATRNSTYVSAEKLANQYPGQVSIIGHNHRLAGYHKTHWINNRPVESHAYSVGHLANIAKLGYVSAPDWQQGGLVVEECGFSLINIKGEKVLWL